MTGRVGWTTATTRSNGNHSSRWMYNRGASERAKIATLSVDSTAPGMTRGRGGICARGPHAATPRKASSANKTSPRDKVLPVIVLGN